MRVLLGVVGFLIFSMAVALALYLLNFGKLSGTEFVAFVVAFAVLALIVGYAPEVQEISIAGNVVKLKEIKAEAIKAIESLNKSRVEMLRVFLGLALKHEGGFGSEGPVDARSGHLWKLFDLAKEYDCQKELKVEIMLALKHLLISQLYSIRWRNKHEGIMCAEPFMEPMDLAAIALDPAGIQAALEQRSPKPDNFVDEIRLALKEYTRLYQLRVEIDSIE